MLKYIYWLVMIEYYVLKNGSFRKNFKFKKIYGVLCSTNHMSFSENTSAIKNRYTKYGSFIQTIKIFNRSRSDLFRDYFVI